MIVACACHDNFSIGLQGNRLAKIIGANWRQSDPPVGKSAVQAAIFHQADNRKVVARNGIQGPARSKNFSIGLYGDRERPIFSGRDIVPDRYPNFPIYAEVVVKTSVRIIANDCKIIIRPDEAGANHHNFFIIL